MTLKVQILQTLRRLFIILVGLTMTWFIEKMLIFNICRHGLMPNLIKKSWTVSSKQILCSKFCTRLNLKIVQGRNHNFFWCNHIEVEPTLNQSNHGSLRPIHLHLIFEISSLKNQVQWTWFFVYFELDFYCLYSLQKSSLK